MHLKKCEFSLLYIDLLSAQSKLAASDSLKYFNTECFETTHDLRNILLQRCAAGYSIRDVTLNIILQFNSLNWKYFVCLLGERICNFFFAFLLS